MAPADKSDPASDLPGLLDAAARGDKASFDRAFALLYQELSALARAQRRRWRGNETLSTTVLVHEAYIKLAGPVNRDLGGAAGTARWEGHRHFFALAAQVMRQVLVNYAQEQRAAKRGGDAERVPLEALDHAPGDDIEAASADDILLVDEALTELARRDTRQAQIVECRFFAGLSIPETANALGISAATVKRDWQLASAWLYQAVARGISE